jgi:hypothetical protein
MKRSSILSSLYRREPALLTGEIVLLGADAPSREVVRERWDAYRSGCFGPLVGFPQLPEWTGDKWRSALHQAPHLEKPVPEGPEAFLASVRDNQIIKPRRFGTLEFRSAPALESGRKVLALAALRLGLCAYVSQRPPDQSPTTSYREAARQWWGIVQGRQPLVPLTRVLEEAKEGLEQRGKGEETFLQPFHEHVEEKECV